MRGSGKEIGELPPVPCTYETCQRHFLTVKEMKRHKKHDSDHYYCYKCDVDCADEDDLLKHKIEIMCHWLYDENFQQTEEGKLGPIHLLCEFCGKEFVTTGGRLKHREQMHRASQNVKCPGCHGIFMQACEMISHLEKGECEEISQADFELAVTNKHILNQIWKNPLEFQENMSNNKGVIARTVPPAVLQVVSNGREEESEDGGVSLVDRNDDWSGHTFLKPEQKCETPGQASYRRVDLETWPRMPGISSSKLCQTMGNLSVQPVNSSVGKSKMDNVTEDRASLKEPIVTEFWPALQKNNLGDNESTITGKSSEPRKTTAWTTGATSKALFGDAKPTPPSMRAPSEVLTEQVDDSSNLFQVGFYMPNSEQFDPDMFFNVVINKYTCPFPSCAIEVDTVADIKAHLTSYHVERVWTCPGGSCNKRFNCASALVAHTEMSSKCLARKGKNYAQALDEITGGFLTATQVDIPEIIDTTKRVVVTGKAIMGVTDVQYASQNGWAMAK